MADNWFVEDGRAQTYGDIMEVLNVRGETIASSFRSSEEPEKAGLPLWLKLALAAAVVVFIDIVF